MLMMVILAHSFLDYTDKPSVGFHKNIFATKIQAGVCNKNSELGIIPNKKKTLYGHHKIKNFIIL